MALAYRREIDGLRAIAVAAVVLYHAGLTRTAGFVGVDIFFVISGYLISALLLREHAATGRIDMIDFYARRARRLFPAVIVLVLAVLLAAELLFNVRQRIAVADSASAAALFLANVFFQHNTGGYFTDVAENMPLLHLWSLSVEEQFYLAWPALLIVLLRWRPLPGLLLLALGSFALAEWWLTTNPQAAFYQTPARVWELAAGGLVAVLPARALPRWVGWLGLLIVVDAVLVPMGRFPGHGALPAVAGAALLLAYVHGGGSNRVLASAPFVGLGLISYSLYLWHWPLLVFYRVDGGNDTAVRLQLCAVAVVLAVGSYRYIEQPLRRWRGPSRRTVSLGFAAIGLLALTAFTTGRIESNTPQAFAARDYPTGPNLCMDRDAADCPQSKVAIWGDSMARAWLPFAEAFGPATGYSRNGCKAVVGFENRLRAGCREWAESVLPYVQHVDTLVIAGRWDFEFFDQDQAGAQAAMRHTLAQLRGVRRVIILGPTPFLRGYAPDCIAGNDMVLCAVPRHVYESRSAPVRAFLQQLPREFGNVEYVEAGDWLCGKFCTATRDGMVLYYDTNHVSATAARAFSKDYLRGRHSLTDRSAAQANGASVAR